MSERVAAAPPRREGLPRPVARAIVCLFLVNTALTVLGTVFAIHAGQKAARADSAQLALCRSGNEARANEIDLWEFLIHLSQPPETTHGKQVLTQFEDHLHTVFAQRDCAHLGRSPSP